MKLKTLEDIFVVWKDGALIEGNKVVPYEPLRAEAIEDLYNIYELDTILEVYLDDKSIDVLSKYIMWKFNITEEELK